MKKLPYNITYSEIQPRLQEKVLQHLKNKVLGQLEKDKTRNINIINFIKSYPVHTLETAGESVLVRGKSDEDWVYISSKCAEEFHKLINGLDEDDKCFAILEDWMLPEITGNREIRSRLTSIKFVFEEGTPHPSVKSTVTDLSAKDAPYIFENSKYKEYISIDYIEERIKNGVALGIHEDGKLVAWAVTHDDGAIGFLNVLEEYRRKGYGTDVTAAMIKRLLELGEVPFVHIEENNIKSTNLAVKAGFRKDRRIHWIKLK
jgi:8-oxo-dGTP diphosphatase